MHHTGRVACFPKLEEHSFVIDSRNQTSIDSCGCKLRSANETGDFSTYRDYDSVERAKNACTRHHDHCSMWSTLAHKFTTDRNKMRSRIPKSLLTERSIIETSSEFKYEHICEHNKPQFKVE